MLRLELPRRSFFFSADDQLGEQKKKTWLTRRHVYSYEALPAHYGLGHNMLAGAFAGIAVCPGSRLEFFEVVVGQRLTRGEGTLCDVPG